MRIALVAVALALVSVGATAQAPPCVVVIEPVTQERFDAFYTRLKSLGYDDGRNTGWSVTTPAASSIGCPRSSPRSSRRSRTASWR